MADAQPPMILYLQNTVGQDVSFTLDPTDDFQKFIQKTTLLIGFEMDLSVITKDRDFKMTDNVYEFLTKSGDGCAEIETETFENLLTVNTGNSNEVVYFLNDGTKIKVHKDVPLSKQSNDSVKSPSPKNTTANIKMYNIPKSPKLNNEFVDKVPFKNLQNTAGIFDRLDTDDSFKTFHIQNSPRSKSRDLRGSFANSLPFDKVENFGFYKHNKENIPYQTYSNPVPTRSSVVLKTSNKRSRKSTPSKFPSERSITLFGLILQHEKNDSLSNCIICKQQTTDKFYVFTPKDIEIFNNKRTAKMKMFCNSCLHRDYEYSRNEINNHVSRGEFLIVKNLKKYVYTKKDIIIDITSPVASPKSQKNIETETLELIPKVEHVIEIDLSKSCLNMKENTQDNVKNTNMLGFTTNDINENSNNVGMNTNTKNTSTVEDITADTSVLIESMKVETKCLDSDEAKSSDIDLIESSNDDIEIVSVNSYLDGVAELKCRFCEIKVKGIAAAVSHSDEHSSNDLFPCILCDYGYNKLAYLRGHMRRKHTRKTIKSNNTIKDLNEDDILIVVEAETDVVHEKDDCGNTAKENDVNDKPIDGYETIGSGNENNDTDPILNHESGEYIHPSIKNKKKLRNGRMNFCENCGKMYASIQSLVKHKCSKFFPHKKPGRKPRQDFIIENENDSFSDLKQVKIYNKTSDTSVKVRAKRLATQLVDEQILICDDCDSNFNSKVRLKFHMLYHIKGQDPSKMKEFKCKQCPNLVYATESELFDHMHFGHRGPKSYKCSVKGCGQTFYVKAMLTKHARRHTDTRRYNCLSCDKKFLDKQTLDEHSMTHLKKKPYECEICGRRLTRASRLRMHMRAHRQTEPSLLFSCVVCNVALANAQLAQEHCTASSHCVEIAKIKKEGGWASPIHEEDEECNTEETLEMSEEQMLVAAEMTKTVTDVCKETITVVLKDKVLRCEYCDYLFCSEQSLREHRETHADKTNPFVCQICKVSFPTYSRCTTHKMTHGFYRNTVQDDKDTEASGPKIKGVDDFPVVKHFLCPECPRTYLHWTFLQVHRRMKHIPCEKELLCDQCDATFHYSWRLKYHRKKFHSGGSAKQPNKRELIDHQIECTNCGERFRNKTALYKHKKKDHGDGQITNNIVRRNESLVDFFKFKPKLQLHYQCSECDRSFRTGWELTAHNRIKHPSFICVIEIKGLNPSPRHVLEEITLHEIPLDRVVEVALMTVKKGDRFTMPSNYKDLNEMMCDLRSKGDLKQWSEDLMDYIHREEDKSVDVSDTLIEMDDEHESVPMEQQEETVVTDIQSILLPTPNPPESLTALPFTTHPVENAPNYQQFAPETNQSNKENYQNFPNQDLGNLQDFYGNPSNFTTFGGNLSYYQTNEYLNDQKFNASTETAENRCVFEEGWFGEVSKVAYSSTSSILCNDLQF